jgi:hypothetical protein
VKLHRNQVLGVLLLAALVLAFLVVRYWKILG